jgi:dipeptidyl aminopeptidase/acylaminoacyl peptidase
MHKKRERFGVCVVMTMLVALNVVAQSPATRVLTGRDLVAVNRAFNVQVSPDGNRVFFQVRIQDLDQNKSIYEWWLTETSASPVPRKLFDGTRRALSWSPNSKFIAYVTANAAEIHLLEVSTLNDVVIAKRSDLTTGFEGLELGVINRLNWSPDGKSIAFTIASKERKSVEAMTGSGSEQAEPWRSVEFSLDPPVPPRGERNANLLSIFDIETGRVRRLTNRDLDISSVAGDPIEWSPDGDRIAFTARPAENFAVREDANNYQANLYWVSKTGDAINTLYKENDSECRDPAFSPDGKRITFGLTRGVDDTRSHSQIMVMSSTGGSVTSLTDVNKISASPDSWSSDGKYIYFAMPYEMREGFFRISSLGSVIENLTPKEQYLSSLSVSADRKTYAFISSSTTEPEEVYVSDSTFTNRRRLTDLNSKLKDIKATLAQIKVETISWRSADGRWDVHGVLVKPPGYEEGKRYPLIVGIRGGPSMVSLTSFGLDGEGLIPALLLASRGYVVLSPNTRGRAGYGQAFARALETERSHTLTAVADVTSAVEELVKRGVVDRNRLGIAGHSYGGSLTSTVITRTNMFKAAWAADFYTQNQIARAVEYTARGRDAMLRYRASSGGRFPLTPDEVKHLIDESQIYFVHNVKTPTLMHCGERSASMSEKLGSGGCRYYFAALRSHNVPSELRIWPDSGHGPSTPLGIAKTYDDEVEWFDYWVRGIATVRMAKRYGPPKNPPENTATATKSERN